MDGQIEVTNRTFETSLGLLVMKNTGGLDDKLVYAAFASNKAPSNAMGLSPFQIVYGYNLCTPFDLIPIPTPT